MIQPTSTQACFCVCAARARKKGMQEWNEYSTRRYHILSEEGQRQMITERNLPPTPEWSILDWFLEDRYCPDYQPYFEKPDFN